MRCSISACEGPDHEYREERVAVMDDPCSRQEEEDVGEEEEGWEPVDHENTACGRHDDIVQ